MLLGLAVAHQHAAFGQAPAAANMAAGVASDKAQGHVTTNTATATISAWLGLDGHQYAADNAAMTKERPTKRAWPHGLPIAPNAVFATTRFPSTPQFGKTACRCPRAPPTNTAANKLWLPATTWSPSPAGLRARLTGQQSLVGQGLPCSTTPSAGKLSPGNTIASPCHAAPPRAQNSPSGELSLHAVGQAIHQGF